MACCENLATILNACAGSRGTAKDIIKFYIACEDDVATIGAATAHVVSTITMEDTKVFFQWDIDPVGSSWKVTTQGEGQAKEYLMTAIVKITGVAAAVSNGLDSLIKGNAIGIIHDKNGLKQIIGAVDDGANVSIEAQNDPNGYIVTFTYTSGHMPYFFSGTVPLTP